MRPILLNSCARAATAAEARFRIDAPIAPTRGVRVIALDPDAATVLSTVEQLPWASARFYTSSAPARLHALSYRPSNGNGHALPLAPELAEVNVVVMVATNGTGGALAAAIGDACVERGIMTAGLALGTGAGSSDLDAAVTILRPHSRVILATADEADVVETLRALRA